MDNPTTNHVTTQDPQDALYCDPIESAVLSALLRYPGEWKRIAGRLTPADFGNGIRQTIFQRMEAGSCSYASVEARLRLHGEYDTCGAELLSCFNDEAGANGIEDDWVPLLKEYALARRVKEQIELLAALPYNPHLDIIQETRRAAERLRTLADAALPPEEDGVISIDELLDTPDEPDVVEDVFPAVGIGMIHADEGQLKSFVGIDALCHIATGQPWAGHQTKRGNVMFVLNEGIDGFKHRLRGWEQARGMHPLDLYGAVFVRQPGKGVPLFDLFNDAHRSALAASIKARGVKVVCFDTLTSMIPGANPNGGDGAMSRALAHVRQIALDAGVFCLVVHHNNKAGVVKGASDFIQGMDARLETKAEKTAQGLPLRVEVTCHKAREDAPVPPMTFDVSLVSIPTEAKPHKTTLALSPATTISPIRESPTVTAYKSLLRLLVKQGGQAQSKKWEQDAQALLGMSHGDFDTYRRAMLEIDHYISKGPGKQDPYQITDTGRALIGIAADGSKQSKQSKTVLDYSDYGNDEGIKQSKQSQSLDCDCLTVFPDVSTVSEEDVPLPIVTTTEGTSAAPITSQPIIVPIADAELGISEEAFVEAMSAPRVKAVKITPAMHNHAAPTPTARAHVAPNDHT